MKKFTILFSILIFIYGCGLTLPGSTSIYKNIHKDVSGQLQDLFGREVEISNVTGILINQIELNDVKIAKGKKLKDGILISAKKVYLNYNPFKLAAHKGDFIPALSKIVIVDPVFTIERAADDTWNMAQLLATPTGEASRSPAFIGRITIKNGAGWYKDNIGYGEPLKGTAFRSRFEKMNGDVDISGSKVKLSVNVTSVVDDSYAYAKIDGTISPATGKYFFSSYVKNLDIGKWSRYIISIPGIDLISGRTDIRMSMTNPPKREKGMPILFNGDFYVRGGNAKVFDKEVKNVYGLINVRDENVTFKNLHGMIFDTPLILNGGISDFTSANYALDLQTNDFDFVRLQQMLGIKPWKIDFSAKGSAKLFIKGDFVHPEFSGRFNVSRGSFAFKKISGPGSFVLDGPILKLKLSGMSFLKGRLFGDGIVDLAASPTTFSLLITTEGSDIKTLTDISTGLSGSANALMRVTGDIYGAKLNGSAIFNECQLIGQSLDNASFNISFLENDVNVENLALYSKNTAFSATGSIKNYSSLDISVECRNMMLSGKGPAGDVKAMINKFNGKLYGSIIPKTAADPFGNINLKGNIFLSDIAVGGQSFYQANGPIKVEKKVLYLDGLLLQVKQSFLNVDGRIGYGVPVELKISGSDVELSEFNQLKSIVPKELQPFKGKADITIKVTGSIPNGSDKKNADILDSLNVSGNLLLKDCVFGSEFLEEGDINFSWIEKKFVLEDSKLRTPESNINLYGTIDTDNLIDMRIKGTLDFANVRPFFHKYGNIFGKVGVEMGLSGTMQSPNISAVFTGTDLRYNKFTVNKLSGNVFYNGELLNFIDPLRIEQKDDEYIVAGKVLLNEVKEGRSTYIKPYLALECNIVKGNLGTLLTFLNTVNTEVLSKQVQISGAGKKASSKARTMQMFDVADFLDKRGVVLYSSEQQGRKPTVIQSLEDINKELKEYKQAAAEEREINASGTIEGYLNLSGDIDNLNGALSLKVSDGMFENYGFDGIDVKVKMTGGTVEVEKAQINKEDGSLKLSGNFNQSSNVSVDIDAVNMPIDFLSLFVGSNRKISGKVSMHTGIQGAFKSPDVYVSLRSSNARISDIKFENISADLAYRNSILDIRSINLTSSNKQANITGSLPFTENRPINIMITVEGESIGLLSFTFPNVIWAGGSGNGSIAVSGTASRPLFNGDFQLNDASVYIKPISARFNKTNSNITIVNNKVSLNSFSTDWIGDSTNNQPNEVVLSGLIDLNDLFASERMVNLNLAFKDNKYVVNFPKLYKGDLICKDLIISGPYYLDNVKPGPDLSGNIRIENCEVILSPVNGSSSIPPVNLNLAIEIGKNSYVTGGEVQDIISTNFSNIFLNLEIEAKDMQISGTLREPNLKGTVKFKSGIVNILNREFSLMSEDRQKELFLSELDKVKENQAAFYGQGGKEGVIPYIDLMSEVKVRAVEAVDETATPPKYKAQDVIIVAKISGMPFVKEQERGIKLAFSSFTEDQAKRQITPGKYSEQDIKVLLLPEFIKKPLGIKEGGSLDTNDVLVDYLNSRLNTFLLRGVEREVARSMDLDKLTLEYNFGKDLRTLLPSQQKELLDIPEMQETAYGVGIEKGLFDRFYINANYARALEERTGINRDLLNYQITYRLNPTLSVIYYREPLSFIEEENNFYKVTLKAGYSF